MFYQLTNNHRIITEIMASLADLCNFVPNGDDEIQLVSTEWSMDTLKSYIDFSNKYTPGMFYLGGQRKISNDYKMSLEFLVEFREYLRQRLIDNPPCSGHDVYSVQKNNKEFDATERMVKCYLQIMEKRNAIN